MAMAEWVLEAPEGAREHGSDGTSDLDRMMRQAAEHLTWQERQELTWQERQELEKAQGTRRHLFATSKGDPGQTSIVQHQINRGDQPAMKQCV